MKILSLKKSSILKLGRIELKMEKIVKCISSVF